MNQNVKVSNENRFCETKPKKQSPVRYYIPAVEKMRLILMGLAILYTFGSYSPLVELNGAILGFVFPALFIISGYVVLWEGPSLDKRILRTIGRTAICFFVMTAVCILLSIIADKELTLTRLSSKWFWMDFLFLNKCALPIGSTIWYVQSLLYAYIIIYVIYKLRMIKLDIVIAVLCLAVTVLTGELSRVIDFSFKGHLYLGGNFLTRALPYILIGSFLHRKKMFFGSKPVVMHTVVGFFGAALAIAEYVLLWKTEYKYYVGHLFGMGIVAVAICMFCFFVDSSEMRSDNLYYLTRFELMIPFFVSSPIYYLLQLFFVSKVGKPFMVASRFLGFFTLILSFAVLFIYAAIKKCIVKRREHAAANQNDYEYMDNAYDKDFEYVDKDAEAEGFHTEYMDNAYDKDFVYVDPDLEEEEDEEE